MKYLLFYVQTVLQKSKKEIKLVNKNLVTKSKAVPVNTKEKKNVQVNKRKEYNSKKIIS